jgi:7,8-dihydropterin-6-yl-methyl-4-(beta-D-ribofuranosyl)aminobenzene 5'-phosphate synthase
MPAPTSPLEPIDRLRVTTVVDGSIDGLRADESVARRFTMERAEGFPRLRAEHGLAHYVEAVRNGTTTRIAFDFGLSDDAYAHNARLLGIDPRGIDVLGLSHGHVDHYGGLRPFLDLHRRAMPARLPMYAGVDHFAHRWFQRGERRVDLGVLARGDLERYDLAVDVVTAPARIAEGVMLSGEMHEPLAFEPVAPTMRVAQGGELVPDTFIGEQTLIAHVRDRGLVIVTACSHRGIAGICRHAARVAGVDKVHAVIGGFHLSGAGAERITRVVDTLVELGVDHVVPQHCTGLEAIVELARRLGPRLVASSVGSTFEFGADT